MKKKDMQEKIKMKKVLLHKSGKVSSYWIQQEKKQISYMCPMNKTKLRYITANMSASKFKSS